MFLVIRLLLQNITVKNRFCYVFGLKDILSEICLVFWLLGFAVFEMLPLDLCFFRVYKLIICFWFLFGFSKQYD